MSRILKAIGLTQGPTTVAQARDNEQPTTSAGSVHAGVADASRDKPLPIAWLLFTAVWLLFPVDHVIQVLRTDLSPVELLALAVSVLAIVLSIFAFGALTSSATALSQSESIAWPSLAELARGVASGWLILMMWCLLGVMLAFVFRGTALPIGLGVVWILGVENLIVNVAAALLDFAKTLQKALPGVNAGSLVSALGGGSDTPGVNTVVDGTQATLVLAAYALVFAFIAGFTLQRRDVT